MEWKTLLAYIYRNGRPRTLGAERISRDGESHFAEPDHGSGNRNYKRPF